LKDNIMNIKTEITVNEYIRDEDNGPGESTLSSNIYIELQGIMPSQKQRARDILNNFYKDLRAELKIAD
jgi:hypothetical protein